MDLEIAGAYIYFTIPIFGGIPVTQTMLSQLIVTIVLCWAFVFLGKDLRKDKPSGRQVMVEKGVSLIQSLVAESMGPQNVHWTPFVATIFLSSLLGSYIGLTGFLRSTTADLSCVIVWAVMVSVIIWYNNIKHNGFLGWLKGFTEPIAVMTPMNIVSEIAQPVSMAFRHFGNVAGGGVITSIIYTAFALVSDLVIGAIASCGWLMCVILMALAAGAFLLGMKKGKLLFKILAAVFFALGLFGLLQHLKILTGVPILSLGIPAVLSVYFDLFSGFVQALVFSLLTMVYVAGACPPPAEAEAAE